MSQQPAKATGFTLLELMITTLLGAMLLLGGTAMFGLFLRNSSATNVRKQINQEGKHIMGWLEYNLRNAQNVSCSGGVVSFKNQRGRDISVRINSSRIEIDLPDTAATGYHPLHTIFSVASGSFTCSPTTNARLVTINFTLDAPNNADPSNLINQNFQTQVQVRNAALR